jgi:hypothetical protein
MVGMNFRKRFLEKAHGSGNGKTEIFPGQKQAIFLRKNPA